MDSAGTALCDWSRATQEPDPEAIATLCKGIENLVRHVRKFPACRGQNYLKAVYEAANAVIVSISRIVVLLPRVGISLIESYQWNQTRRIKDLPPSPLQHLVMSWGSWLVQLSESIVEVGRISSSEEEMAAASYDDDDGEEWQRDMVKSMSSSEISMAADCLAILKLCKGLMKRVRTRVLNCASEESIEKIRTIDALYLAGHSLEVEVDQLATAVFPPHDNFTIRSLAIKLVEAAQDLAELSKTACDEDNEVWFEKVSIQFDRILSLVLGRCPLR